MIGIVVHASGNGQRFLESLIVIGGNYMWKRVKNQRKTEETLFIMRDMCSMLRVVVWLW